MAITRTPGMGCSRTRRASCLSAGGHDEHPSDVKSSTSTGTACLPPASIDVTPRAWQAAASEAVASATTARRAQVRFHISSLLARGTPSTQAIPPRRDYYVRHVGTVTCDG